MPKQLTDLIAPDWAEALGPVEDNIRWAYFDGIAQLPVEKAKVRKCPMTIKAKTARVTKTAP